MADILIVDDEQSVAEAFERFLRYEGHTPHVVSGGEDALRHLELMSPELVVMDVRMPGMGGLQTLEEIRRRFPDVYVVIMTAYGSSQTSIDAIRAGAFDYLTKPLDLDHVRSVVNKALAAQRVRRDILQSGETTPRAAALVGESPAMLEVYKLIGRLASNDVPALVVGERGTGKGLVVASIHENSARSGQPLISLDCTTTQESVLGDALFGANEGTLHLSAVEDLPIALQSRLVRAFESRGMRPAPASGARVIASTAVNLADRVAAGAFDAELRDFLAVITLNLPPLRQRQEDIAPLARAFVRRFSEELGRAIAGIEDEALRALSEYSWPGNVAELQYAVKRACVIAGGDVITRADLGDSLSGRRVSIIDAAASITQVARATLQDRLAASTPVASPYHEIVGEVEEALVDEALKITRGNQVKAAELLGLNRATLRKKAGIGEPPSSAS